MKVRYIKEGYFNNPNQAKAAIAKKNNLTSVEKLAAASTNVFNSEVRNAIQTIISDAAIPFFPLSKVFVQPISGDGRWKFSNPFNNQVKIKSVDFENKKIYFDVELGSMVTYDGKEYTNLLAYIDPYFSYNISEDKGCDEVKKVLTDRGVRAAKKQVAASSKNNTYKNAPAEKVARDMITESEFICENICITIIDKLRFKNYYGKTMYRPQDTDTIFEHMVEIITFVPTKNTSSVIFRYDEPEFVNMPLKLTDYGANEDLTLLTKFLVTYKMADVSLFFNGIPGNRWTTGVLNSEDISAPRFDGIKQDINDEIEKVLKAKNDIKVKYINYSFSKDVVNVYNITNKSFNKDYGNKVKDRRLVITYNFPGSLGDNSILIYTRPQDGVRAYVNIELANGIKPKNMKNLREDHTVDYWAILNKAAYNPVTAIDVLKNYLYYELKEGRCYVSFKTNNGNYYGPYLGSYSLEDWRKTLTINGTDYNKRDTPHDWISIKTVNDMYRLTNNLFKEGKKQFE